MLSVFPPYHAQHKSRETFSKKFLLLLFVTFLMMMQRRFIFEMESIFQFDKNDNKRNETKRETTRRNGLNHREKKHKNEMIKILALRMRENPDPLKLNDIFQHIIICNCCNAGNNKYVIFVIIHTYTHLI